MSDVLHDEWDRAYEAGREAGRKEAWNGDYDYAYLVSQAESDGRRRGWHEALDAARKVVAAQQYIPLQDKKAFIITRNAKLWKRRDSWTEFGWWGFRDSALAAIDALREERE